MWVNRVLFETVLADNKKQTDDIASLKVSCERFATESISLRVQKAKDDLTIDWMRHRINALEKERAILLQKSAGIALPTPEIVPTRPGSMTIPNFDTMPSFEDVGDTEAARLGIKHDPEGVVEYVDSHQKA